MDEQIKKYAKNRNRWRKYVGYSEGKPNKQSFLDGKTNVPYTLDLNKVVKQYDYFKVLGYPPGMVIDYVFDDLPLGYYTEIFYINNTIGSSGIIIGSLPLFSGISVQPDNPVIVLENRGTNPNVNLFIQKVVKTSTNYLVYVGSSGSEVQASFRIIGVWSPTSTFPMKTNRGYGPDVAVDAKILDATLVTEYNHSLYGINTPTPADGIDIYQNIHPKPGTDDGTNSTDVYGEITANKEAGDISVSLSAPTAVNDAHIIVIYN